MTLIPNLDGSSRVYAVLGDPVAQVQTPRLINPLFAERGLNLYAVPFHVPAAALPEAWRFLVATPNVAGIGVTVPHKIAAAGLCDTLTPTARRVGAVNSIQRRPDGTTHGALFDGIGFVRGLKGNRGRLSGASVLLVGAGGAGRTIADALAAEGIARLTVVDVDETARDTTINMVNDRVGDSLAAAGAASLTGHSVLINATPIGLKPEDRFPADLAALDSSVLVADIAALKGQTPLLALAEARGCETSDGSDMLEAQITLIADFATG